MSLSFKVEFDLASIDGIAEKLTKLSGEGLGRGLLTTLNEVTDRAYTTTRNDMLRTINLTQEYVESKMTVNKAKDPEILSSSIVAAGPGNGKAGATLGRYGPSQQIVPVNWSNARIESLGKKFSRWPGWTRRKGDKARDIPVDMKQDGVKVAVKRGSLKMFDHAFLMKLSNSGAIGLFTRSADGQRIRHRYGPAVYQLFRVAADTYVTEIGDDLEKSIGDEAERLFTEAMK